MCFDRRIWFGICLLVFFSSAWGQTNSSMNQSYVELGYGAVDNGGDGNSWGVEMFIRTPGFFYLRAGFSGTSIENRYYETDSQELSFLVGGQFNFAKNLSFNIGAGLMMANFETRWDDESEPGYMYELGFRFVPGPFSTELFLRDGKLFEDNIETEATGTLKLAYLFTDNFGVFAAYDSSSDVNRIRGGLKFSW